MNEISVWQEVITTALVGTQRQPLTLNLPNNQLGEFLHRLDQGNPESNLLAHAGAIAIYQIVGILPNKTEQQLPEPCPLDEHPCCSPSAAHDLAFMLKRGDRDNTPPLEILIEWLSALATAGKRVPEQYLPELLELGRQHKKLQPYIMTGLGKRGKWLSEQNPNWVYGVQVDDEGIDPQTIWETGTKGTRRSMLQKLRAQDSNYARELLASTWEKENSEDRIVFIESLAIGLSSADEPFLETALSDRRKEVRRTASDLLAKLPESQLCERMWVRVQPLLSLKSENSELDVILPEICDKNMIHDGIEATPPRHISDRAWWLQQMLGMIPPKRWSKIWNIQPNALKFFITSVANHNYSSILIEGWAIATDRHQDQDWAEALLNLWPNLLSEALLPKLLTVLNVEQRDNLLINILQRTQQDLTGSQKVWTLLSQNRFPWSHKLTIAVIETIKARIINGKKDTYDWELRSALKQFACHLNLEAIAEISEQFISLKTDQPFWEDALQEVLNLLNFRLRMLGEI